jgi:hypothetical protein
MLAELEGSGFVLTQRHSLGTEFVRCSFPAIPQDMAKGVTQVVRGETELKTVKSAKPARQGRKARARAARALHEEPQSRHTREACTSYALACEADRQDIRSPFGFGLSLYRSGNQDDEVALFLKTGEVRKASSAA